jgi:Cysteine-rich CPCC
MGTWLRGTGSRPSHLEAVRRVNAHLWNLVHPGMDALHTRFRCPCCGYKTLETAGALGLCPVCWWEDDGQEDEDAAEVRLTVNGMLSLNEARQHFADCGASHPRYVPHVRKPGVTEQ